MTGTLTAAGIIAALGLLCIMTWLAWRGNA